jgi:hypothetical protein
VNTPEQQQDADQQEQKLTEKPEVTDEHKAQAKEMAKSYEDDRPTAVMPGSGGTVSGTAISDWVDDDNKDDNKDANRDDDKDDDKDAGG